MDDSPSSLSQDKSSFSPTSPQSAGLMEKFEKKIDFKENINKLLRREDSDLLSYSGTMKDKLFAIKEEDEEMIDSKKKSEKSEHMPTIQDAEEMADINTANPTPDRMSQSQFKRLVSHVAPKEQNLLSSEKLQTLAQDKNTASTKHKESDDESDYKGEEELEREAFVYRKETRFRDVRWIIFPDDVAREFWDMVLTVNLLYTAVFTPYIVAFNSDDTTLAIFDYCSNGLFFVDIIVNFFTAYFDRHDNLIVRHRKIAWEYLKTWFLIDIVSVFPFDQVFESRQYNSLLRFARLPRLYRFLRLAKLAKMMRLIKDRSKIARYLNEWLKLEAGIERLFLTVISFLLFCHIAACGWYLIADINSEDPSNWIMRFSYMDASPYELYVAAFYYIAQTFVTVGYGDINPGNTLERFVAICLMFIGAFIYSVNVGSLSTILSSLDSRNALFEEKMGVLVKIRQNYRIENQLYVRIKKALKYGHNKSDASQVGFLTELPQHLRTDLT
jgi:hypothetical protein